MATISTTVRIPVQQRRRLARLASSPDYKTAAGPNLSAALRDALAIGIETLETKRKEVTLDEH